MRELRKKVLQETTKTVSRKARLRPDSLLNTPATSPGHSRASSAANSRAGSRYASEDEDASSSEDEKVNTSGSDDVADDDSTTAWMEQLQDKISELQDRKKTSTQGRDRTLKGYLYLIRHHFAQQQIEGHERDIVNGLLKSVKTGSSPDEMLSAMRSLSATLATSPSDWVFDPAYRLLKSACEDSGEENVKAGAIYALAAAVLWGGGSESAITEVMEFFLEIIESDGHSVSAPDNGNVVVAALESWGFLATFADDLELQWEPATEAFAEQLESADPEVQACAALNIALVLELWREQGNESKSPDGVNLYKITSRLTEVSRNASRSVKSVSKQNRRLLKSDITSVLTSIEHGVGPNFSTVERIEGGVMGYRGRVRIQNVHLLVQSYTLQTRVEMVRAIFAGGFSTHCARNPIVTDLLDEAEIECVNEENSRPSSKLPSKWSAQEDAPNYKRSRLVESRLMSENSIVDED